MTQPTPPDVSCPSCGTSNQYDSRFCRMCGFALLAASSPNPAQPPASHPDDSPQAVPTAQQAAAAPNPSRPPSASGPGGQPPRRGFPWVLLLAAAAAGLLLLVACVGGALWFFTSSRQVIAPQPSPVEATVVVAPTATAEPAGAVSTATVEATPTDAVAASASATAMAEAVATSVTVRQTAIAAALATETPPTPEPTVGLAPEPGQLTLADYQALVGTYSQRLFETFDRGERTKAIWSQFDNEDVAARLRNNFYALTLKGPDKNMWEVWDRDLGSEYNVELSVAFETTGVPTTVGIAFDVQPEGNNGVFFEVFNDKHWQLRTVRDGRLVPELTTGRIPLPELQDGVGTNVLWVVRRPDHVQLWINSVHVATVPSSPFDGGRAGVIASSRQGLSGPATVIADNFRVRTP